jgi:hypothetical protein
MKDPDGNGMPETIAESGVVTISTCTKPFSQSYSSLFNKATL